MAIDWKPISTAPKPYTRISADVLLLVDGESRFGYADGSVHRLCTGDGEGRVVYPTHWAENPYRTEHGD